MFENTENDISYEKMSDELGIPLCLFQQIAFGITKLLPKFLIQQISYWIDNSNFQQTYPKYTLRDQNMRDIRIN